VTDVIHQTPPPVSASKIVIAETAEANILLKMAEEEAVVATVNTATEKGKEQVEDILEEENFNFQDLLGQDLTSAEKEELKKYAISCGYKPGSTLFGGVNEGS
jgi:hypothetical protein